MNSKLKDFLSTSLYLLVAVIIAFLIVRFVGQRTEVIGSSMLPTLEDGNNLILDKISYKIHEPERYDIIVFPFRNNSGKNYIKRIIGMPGETIQIDTDGNIYIDGEILYETYGLEIIKNPGNALEPITLSADQYFVLGDNRNNSEDSRFSEVGLVSRDEIMGKVWLRIWPFNEFGVVNKN